MVPNFKPQQIISPKPVLVLPMVPCQLGLREHWIYIYIWDRGNNRAPLQSFNSSRLCLRTSQQMKCLYLIASLDEFLGLGNHLGTISAVRIDFLKAVQARQSCPNWPDVS